MTNQLPGLAQAHSPSTPLHGIVPKGTSQLANPALAVLLDAPLTPSTQGYVQVVLGYGQSRLNLRKCNLPVFFCGQYIIYLLLIGSQ